MSSPRKYINIKFKCSCGSENKSIAVLNAMRGETCHRCGGSGMATRKEQLLLCIGGKYDGKELNWTAIKFDGYRRYNAGDRTKGRAAVFLHESLADD